MLEQHGLWLKQGWLVTCRAGAFCGILLLSGLSQWLEPAYNLPLLYASFGASAVLVFGVISSPLAQPRNFVGKVHLKLDLDNKLPCQQVYALLDKC